MSEPLVSLDVAAATQLLEKLAATAPEAPETDQLRNLVMMPGADRVYLEQAQHARIVELAAP